MKTFIKIAIVLSIGFYSCKKDKKTETPEPEPTVVTGSLKLNFENLVDTLPLDFVTNYVNANGDTFKISKFNYYISNIVITKTDNSTFTEPNSYHLVQASDAQSSLITLSKVPLGSYKSISFMLGVDSTRNCSGVQDGDLAVSKNMFWSWSTGYIMVKLEGSSPQSGATTKALTLHLGGYYGVNKAQRNFNFSFGTSTANVSESIAPMVHLAVDASKMFKGQNTISFATNYFQMSPGAAVKKFADNYAEMIEFEHVHND